MRRVAAPGVTALLVAAALVGCQQNDTQNTPNRVLDRPTDVVLVCADRVCEDLDGDGKESCQAVMQPLSVCQQDSGSCGSDNPHLVGFVANSERNEVAMFTKCANRLIDMNVETPGYNFVPTGILPTSLAATNNGCRVYAANVGSCDLALLDAQGLAHYGLELDPPTDQASSLVSRIQPRRFDSVLGAWLPLGARPGEIVAVPSSLSTAPTLDPGIILDANCDPRTSGSVYVSFPTCNLIAEVDVLTGNILQSRQFTADGQGGVSVVDTGISPVCPVECPAQFADGVPADLPSVDPDGPFPQAIELLVPPTPPEDFSNGATNFDEADESIDSQSLFVGGLGSDILFELHISDDGLWQGSVNTLALADAGGIKRIRVSPAMSRGVGNGPSNFVQFLYVIAGDGSTRVVGRDLPTPDDVLGIECETQLDPVASEVAGDLLCVPVSQVPSDAAPAERRGLALGPGIRAGGGGEITDWMFRKVYQGDLGSSGPFTEPGVVAVGVTSQAEAMYVLIDQERVREGRTQVSELPDVPSNYDPQSVMDVRLFPHAQWVDPGYDSPAGLPSVQNEPTARSVPSDSGPVRYLSPSLRLIDGAYLEDEWAAGSLDVGTDQDRLASDLILVGEDPRPLYDEAVPKIFVHDYRSWGASQWNMEWEATLIANASTGRIDCKSPGWQGGTCLVSAADDARLLDDSASFCEGGVLPGDKLVLIGCYDDGDCGDGRRCLRESAGGGESTGICISAQTYEEDAAALRQVCGNFIADPCGEAYREFTITRAFQDELWIQAMDQRPLSYLVVDESGDEPVFTEVEGQFICADDQPSDGCVSDQDCVDFFTELDGVAPEEPWLCIEDRCRRPCEDADECLLRRLPGPACFGEFVRYQVALRNAFRITGPVGFPNQLVEIDPNTGECRPTQDSEISRLLTSRLPIPASDDPDDPEWQAIPICPSDVVEPSDPNPCRIVAARNGNRSFHNLAYLGETVSALRFSNPIFSLVVDLTSLDSLTAPIPGYDDYNWYAEAARFRRSRIPRGYRETFRLDTGYQPFSDFLTLEGRAVTYPVRIVAAPTANVAFVVDGSGPGTASAVRGQVLRVILGDTVSADEAFIGVR